MLVCVLPPTGCEPLEAKLQKVKGLSITKGQSRGYKVQHREPGQHCNSPTRRPCLGVLWAQAWGQVWAQGALNELSLLPSAAGTTPLHRGEN